MLPNRTTSCDIRPISDMQVPNENTSKFDHPPARQPRRRELARLGYWWKARHPQVPLVCAKRDVSRAFKWHSLAPADVPEFGTRLPGQHVDVPGDMLVVYCVLTFGWTGFPGEFMVQAWGVKRVHASHRPPRPWANGTVAFASK